MHKISVDSHKQILARTALVSLQPERRRIDTDKMIMHTFRIPAQTQPPQNARGTVEKFLARVGGW